MEFKRLRVGDSGDEVAALHERLNLHGENVSPEEQKRKFFGPSTRRALSEFQKKNSIDPSCELCDKTESLLASEPLATKSTPASILRPSIPASLNISEPQAANPVIATPTLTSTNLRAEVEAKSDTSCPQPITSPGEVSRAIPRTESGQRLIQGRIFLDHGEPGGGITLRIYNHGFGGEEKLGEIKTDDQGSYSLPYDLAGKPANLEVRAIDGQGNEISLSAVKFDAAEKELLNLVAPGKIRPLAAEFERLRVDIDKHLGAKGRLAEAQETANRRDLTILHRATGWDARLIAFAATATRLSEETSIPQNILYALFRAGLPSDSEKLALVSTEEVERALEKAKESGIVSLDDGEMAKGKAAFDSFARKTRRMIKATGTLSNFGELLDRSGLADLGQRDKFEEIYFANRGTAKELWEMARAEGISEENINHLQMQGKLAYLTLNNADLVSSLQREINSPDKLVKLVDKDLYRPEAWKSKIRELAGSDIDTAVPPAYAGKTADERLNAYAEDLSRKVRLSFPTQVVRRMIENKEMSLGTENALNTSIITFLKNAGTLGFELGQISMDAFIEQHKDRVFQGIPPDQVEATTQRAKLLYRLHQITPSNEALKTALDLGFTSAHDIVAVPCGVFLNRYGEYFPSRYEAELMYRKAQQVTAVVYNAFTMIKLVDSTPPLYAVSGTAKQHEDAKAQLKARLKGYPSMESLFGSLDFCDCEHCRSVLSPAAYFVDLLKFLDPDPMEWEGTLNDWRKTHNNAPYPFSDQSALNDFLNDWPSTHQGEPAPDINKKPFMTEKKPYEILVERRPDLPHIPLTCENTNTVLPHIDVANEILEYYVAHKNLTKDAAHDTGEATTPELLAEPQYVIPTAYNALKEARYPLMLPFDLWLETIRLFFDHFDTPLWHVSEVFRKTDNLFDPKASYDRSAIFIEYLGLSPSEYSIFTGLTPNRWHELYGYETENEALDELKSAKTLSRRLGISYKELVEIVRTGFVNPGLDALSILWRLQLDVGDVMRYFRYRGKSARSVKEFEDKLQVFDYTYRAFGLNIKKELERLWDDGIFKQTLVLWDTSTLCDFAKTHLEFADGTPADYLVYHKINLFVRLWRRLGWSIEETDRALQVFMPKKSPSSTSLSLEEAFKTSLIYLAHLKAIDNQVKAGKNSRLKLLTFWSNLTTKGENSLYAQLFLTRSVLKDDPTFDDPLGNYLSKEAFVKDHLLSLQGALNLTQNEIWLILADAGLKLEARLDTPSETNDILAKAVFHPMRSIPLTLSLDIVSLLYRYGLLAKVLKMSLNELIALKALSGLDPFKPLSEGTLETINEDPIKDDHPFSQTLQFIKVAEKVKESGFKVEDLNYLLRHRFDPAGKYRSDPIALLALVKLLASDILRVQTEHAIPEDPSTLTDDLLRQKMALVLPSDVVDIFMRMWTGTVEYEATKDEVDPKDKLVLETYAAEPAIRRVEYDSTRGEQHLTYRGVLLDEQLKNLTAKFPSYLFADLLKEVQRKAKEFFEKLKVDSEKQVGFLEDGDFVQLFAPLDALSNADKQKAMANKRDRLAKAFLPFLQKKLTCQLIVQALTNNMNGELELIEALLTDSHLLADPSQSNRPLLDAFAALGKRGVSMTLFDDNGATLKSIYAATAETKTNEFCWDKIPGKDNERLIEFLVRKFGVDWVKAAEIKRIDNGKTIEVSSKKNSLSLKLNDKKTKATVEIDGVAKGEFTAKIENDVLNIYDDEITSKAKSIRFESYLEVAASGPYRFFAVIEKHKGTEAELSFAHQPDWSFKHTAASDEREEFSEFIELKAGVPYSFRLEARNLDSGNVALLVQGESLPKGPFHQLTIYPQAAVERARSAQLILAKSLQLIQGLGLSEKEVRYMRTHADDFDKFDLSKLPARDEDDSPDNAKSLFKQFLRLVDYGILKRTIAGDTDDLVGLFEAASITISAKKTEESMPDTLCNRIADLTRRDVTVVQKTAQELGIKASDLTQEKGIRRLWDALQIVEKLGVPADKIVLWTEILSTKAETDHSAIARHMRNVAKARYEPENWLRIAQPIFDKLRQRKRNALVAYIMYRCGFERMEQLFEYFLIDPGMEPVVQTSRLRLAISSVQLFIQRCLLNLEPEVHPTAIKSKHWQWMKRYRVWEANRKIFLYPENWLEPEFRDDKTHLFQELESALLQGDVSNNLAEDAFFQYLKKLEDLARLEIVSMYCEEKTKPELNTLHVIGRTYNQPHKYFYRRYSNHMWTPWEPVTAEIEGDHIVAVVWRERLHLFWVTFLEKVAGF
jgi:hypothetical protein